MGIKWNVMECTGIYSWDLFMGYSGTFGWNSPSWGYGQLPGPRSFDQIWPDGANPRSLGNMRSPLSHLTAVVWIAFPSQPISATVLLLRRRICWLREQQLRDCLVSSWRRGRFLLLAKHGCRRDGGDWARGSGDAMGNEGNAEMKWEPEHVQMCTFKESRIAGNTHILNKEESLVYGVLLSKWHFHGYICQVANCSTSFHSATNSPIWCHEKPPEKLSPDRSSKSHNGYGNPTIRRLFLC